MSQMNQISRMLQGQQGGGGQPNADTPQVDTAEQIFVSSLALIKMLKHGAELLVVLKCLDRYRRGLCACAADSSGSGSQGLSVACWT